MKDKIINKIVGWMPRRMLYFAVIRAWAIATTGKYGDRTPDSLRWDDVLKSL